MPSTDTNSHVIASTTEKDSGLTPSVEDQTSTATDSVVVETRMVPASTLYGVAGGLSVALFLAILVIVYLVWRLMKKKDVDAEPLVNPYPKEEDDDSKSSVGSVVYQNGVYIEEDETNFKPYDEVDANATSFGQYEEVTDLDAPDDEQTTDAVSNHSVPFEETNSLTPENVEDIDESENAEEVSATQESQEDQVEIDEEDEEEAAAEDDRNLLLGAAVASAAFETKSIESIPGEIDVPEPIIFLPHEIVQEEKVIKESVEGSVKLVILKGHGYDGEDVKAILKSFDLDMSTTSEVAKVKRKIALMEKLTEMDHPNVAKYYGCYEKDGYLSYAVKYAENGCLKDNLETAAMDANTLMRIMSNIGKGLQYLHAKNITHGKLWSKAVMLDGENNPMLTDIEGGDELVYDGEILRWHALEVVEQTSRCTPASDVWSYGTLMWEIVSQGAIPYEGIPLLDLPSKMRESQLQKPKQCSDSLFTIMTTCWNKNTKMRPDMYVINSNLSEKLVEDSNEHISVELKNPGFAMSPQDFGDDDDLAQPPSPEKDFDSDADYTAF